MSVILSQLTDKIVAKNSDFMLGDEFSEMK
jgi:hypothetical protein